ncbi:DUF6881 domain-containing protein [uncultured Dysosmobacter sp.]|uniref:DUF6881 domain-containing protein n=1 Tax=uncultured Dysosmobacter sp. TaxID=2591384 RepID=UPI0026071036|nr:hypothetical protein [uncultured Dysosmobacter sp.]
MEYVLVEWTHEYEDEPYEIYSELDADRREVRKVEFFRNGLCFSYGGDRGNCDALADVPFPENLRVIGQTEGMTARSISRSHFLEVWNQAQERPDGFMGMFF